ncbi:MAG: DUF3429 domain-containing protein [Pseudomonadota bacterium]
MSLRKAAFWLGLTGYIPFGFLALGMVVGGDHASTAQTLLIGYAAVILSFLGGIRWGIGLVAQDGERQALTLALSIVPSLWAWVAAFIGGNVAFLMFAVGFIAMGWWDNKLVVDGGAPIWFGSLRLMLTGLVTLTMLAASFAAL